MPNTLSSKNLLEPLVRAEKPHKSEDSPAELGKSGEYGKWESRSQPLRLQLAGSALETVTADSAEQLVCLVTCKQTS